MKYEVSISLYDLDIGLRVFVVFSEKLKVKLAHVDPYNESVLIEYDTKGPPNSFAVFYNINISPVEEIVKRFKLIEKIVGFRGLSYSVLQAINNLAKGDIKSTEYVIRAEDGLLPIFRVIMTEDIDEITKILEMDRDSAMLRLKALMIANAMT